MLPPKSYLALLLSAFLAAGCDQSEAGESDSGSEQRAQAAQSLGGAVEEAKEALGAILGPASEAFGMLRGDAARDGTVTGGVLKAVRWTSVDDLLDEVLEQLGGVGAGALRARIRQTDTEIEGLRLRVSEVREALLTAKPEQRQGVVDGLLASSREDLETELSDSQKRIAELQNRSKEERGRFVRQMRELGLDFDEEKADTLLATATGDDFVELCVVVSTLRDVVIELQALASQSGRAESAQRYYGVYIVLLKAVERLHANFVERIEKSLLPRLEELAARAEELIGQIEVVIANGGDAELGRKNQEANRLTLRAIGVYRAFLEKQAVSVRQRIAAVASALIDAETTYATMEISAEVAAMIRDGLQILKSLEQLQLPPFTGFENQDLRAELDRLTVQLGKG
jgi:hypothetical protein